MEVIDEMLSFRRGNILPILAETDLARWVALSRVPGLGCVSFKKLAGHFEDPTEALSASKSGGVSTRSAAMASRPLRTSLA